MTRNIDLQTAKSLIQDFKLPPKPHLLIKIKQAYPELNDIAKLISEDEAAASTILRIVNSPVYATTQKINSVMQAVSLLGLEKVMNVVNSVLVANSMKSAVPEHLLENYWLANHKVSIAAAELAKRVEGIDGDEAYMLALFHNSGIAMLLQKHQDYFDRLAEWEGLDEETIDALEDREFGNSHSMLSYILAKSWGIDKSIAIAIREHHQLQRFTHPTDDPVKPSEKLTALLKLAESIAEEHEIFTNTGYTEWSNIETGILDVLGLTDDDYLDLREDIGDIMADSELNFFS